MKVTALKIQARNKDRVNVFIDGVYSFSLDMSQVVSLGVKTGNEYTEDELARLKDESLFGKLYMRAFEYSLVRPRSQRELKDYLYRKTRPTRTKMGALKEGYSKALTERVFEQLLEKGYLNDTKFAEFWVENRNVRKGTSVRRLRSELSAKGVDKSIIDGVLEQSDRAEGDEIQKVIAKKASKYDDDQKFIAYLARQGFGYDDIKEGLATFREGQQESD